MSIDCDLVQLDNARWWCPAPGCDNDKKRLLSGNFRRNCRSPEVNAAAKARQQQLKTNLAFCLRECPASMWDHEEDYCQRHGDEPCQFNRLLASPFFECKYWPKLVTTE
jgi:hypothetical protein